MRRSVVWFAVFGALLVLSAAPASAASVASVNTTDQDFQQASLESMSITGTGESASVTGDVGFSESINTGSVINDLSQTGDSGVTFTVSADRGYVVAELENTDATTADLRYGNGTQIGSKSVSAFSSVQFNHSFVPGTDYVLAVDAGGSSYDFEVYSQSPTISDGALSITGDEDGDAGSNIRSIAGLKTGDATEIRYVGDSHVADADTLFADLSSVGGSVTVKAQANSAGGWSTVDSATISSPQNLTLDISTSTATEYRTVVEAASTTPEYTVTLDDEGVEFTSSGPSLSNPDPADGSDISSYDGDVSVELNDPDFALAQSDRVTITLDDSTGQVDSQDVTQNGTVSIQYNAKLGENNLTWTATDEFGNSDTLTQNFSTPTGLAIYNESDPSSLVDDATVEVTFISSNTTVIKNASDGTVSFGSLPGDEAFLAQVQAPGYRSRTVYIPSLLEQESVYLLNENVTAVQARFTLADATGTFDEQSRLYIEKPITINGSTEYRTLVSDEIGVDGVTVFLEKNRRYQLRIVSNDGTATSQLGGYDATLNETIELEPSAAAVEAEQGEAVRYNASYDKSGPTVSLEFVDPAEQTISLDVTIVAQDGTVIREEQSYAGTQSLSATYALGSQLNQTAYVVAEVSRGGTVETYRQAIGPKQRIVAPADLDNVWMQVGAGVMILLVGGLFSQLNVAAGAVVTSMFAGVLWFLGLLSGLASGATVALAIGLSTLNLLLQR